MVTLMMRRYAYLICLVLLLLCGIDFYAQQWNYPEDMLNVEYPYYTTVKFEGASPDIADFVTSYISDLDTTMDGLNYVDVWKSYLRHEEQKPGTEIVVDKKNGYVRITTEYSIDFDGKDHIYKTIHEMCYWNCADGKHKLFALNFNIMTEGTMPVISCGTLPSMNSVWRQILSPKRSLSLPIGYLGKVRTSSKRHTTLHDPKR